MLLASGLWRSAKSCRSQDASATSSATTRYYAVFLGGNLVSWSSKRQPVVSRSSAEAEYWAVANGVAEASWLRQLLAELHSPLAKSTLIYCDNVSTVYLSTNPVQHQRTKHVEIDLHFVCDRVAIGDVRLLHVPTTSQFADIHQVTTLLDLFGVSLQPQRSRWLVVAGGVFALCTFFLSSLEHRCDGSSDCGGCWCILSPCIEAHLEAHV